MPVDKSAQRVRRMFGEIAGRYDFLNHLLSLNVDRYWRWRTVRKAPLVGEGPVLDVCCGTGDLTLAYARAAQRTTAEKLRGESPLTPALSPEGRGGPTTACGSLAAHEILAVPVVGADFCHEMLVRAADKSRLAKSDD